LYNRIPIALQRDVQAVFHFPLDNLAHDPYNMVVWHLLLLLPQWCLILPLHGGATGHREMQIQLRHFLTCD
jgi:hypothetical protein